jgi:tRNA(adenine34) deaminase
VSLWAALEHPWQIAFTEAWNAYCAGSLPVGAAIFTGETLFTSGRNRISETHGIATHVSGSLIAHAELNAIAHLPQDTDTSGFALYATLEPCPLCTGAIRMADIPRIHFAARDPFAGSTAWLQQHPYLARGKVQTHPPKQAIPEIISMGWLMCSVFEREGLGNTGFQRGYQQLQPASVPLALHLYEHHTLTRARDNALEARQIFDTTVGLIP